jgi:hypothetical protein
VGKKDHELALSPLTLSVKKFAGCMRVRVTREKVGHGTILAAEDLPGCETRKDAMGPRNDLEVH